MESHPLSIRTLDAVASRQIYFAIARPRRHPYPNDPCRASIFHQPTINRMRRIEFKRWPEFRSWIDDDRQILPVYWRSQKDWALASSFEREILKMNGAG